MNRRRWPKGTYMRIRSGALLSELMKGRNASNADVGRAAGQHRSLISALRNERRKTCTTETAERIAGYFQVPVEVLFEPRASAASGQNMKVAAA